MTSPEHDDVEVLLRRLDPGLPEPGYAHPGDAGADLYARVPVTLGPGERASVPTGVAIALPAGYAAFVHPRSGLAARLGVTTLNGPGTVDAGYRGEVLVTLVNTDRSCAAHLARGDRIAQLVVQRVARARFVPVERLPDSPRGDGGHGSTGGYRPAGGPPTPGALGVPDPVTTTTAGEQGGPPAADTSRDPSVPGGEQQ